MPAYPAGAPPNAYILHILDSECPHPTMPPAKRLVTLEARKQRELQTYLALAAKRLLHEEEDA
jgi:hypothetical protein